MKSPLFRLMKLAGSLILIGCGSFSGQEREFKRSKVTAFSENNKVVFNVSEVVNGIRTIVISDENTNEILWKVHPKTYTKTKVVYGDMDQFLEVSKIPNRPPTQEVPQNSGKAPSLKGRLIRAEFEIQYDAIMSANVGTVAGVFQM